MADTEKDVNRAAAAPQEEASAAQAAPEAPQPETQDAEKTEKKEKHAEGKAHAELAALKTKLEQGDQYGMRGASALDKEWYEHSEGWCDYLKGRTRAEVASIPDDGSDADLAAVCTISVTELQKAALAAFAEE